MIFFTPSRGYKRERQRVIFLRWLELVFFRDPPYVKAPKYFAAELLLQPPSNQFSYAPSASEWVRENGVDSRIVCFKRTSKAGTHEKHAVDRFS